MKVLDAVVMDIYGDKILMVIEVLWEAIPRESFFNEKKEKKKTQLSEMYEMFFLPLFNEEVLPILLPINPG